MANTGRSRLNDCQFRILRHQRPHPRLRTPLQRHQQAMIRPSHPVPAPQVLLDLPQQGSRHLRIGHRPVCARGFGQTVVVDQHTQLVAGRLSSTSTMATSVARSPMAGERPVVSKSMTAMQWLLMGLVFVDESSCKEKHHEVHLLQVHFMVLIMGPGWRRHQPGFTRFCFSLTCRRLPPAP